jgi:hypothetical protein
MKRSLLHFIVILVWLIPCKTSAYTSKDCIRCHSEDSKQSSLHISIKEFQGSVHGSEITCEDCHTGIRNEEHGKVVGSGVVDCSQCHEQKNLHGLASKRDNRPRCHSCHTKHGILRKDDKASTVHPDHLKNACKGCHPVECGETDYFSWLPSKQIMSHKKMDFSQTFGKDNCIGCHQGQGAHGEKAQLNEQNCHICHMSVKDQGAVWGYIHARANFEKQPVIFTAATIYQILIVLLLLVGFRFYILKLLGKKRERRK